MIYKLISPTESQVGKYIDTNGDGICVPPLQLVVG